MIEQLFRFWSRLSIRSKGTVVIALPILCLAIAIVISSLLSRRVELAEQEVKHTQEVQLHSEQILRLLVDAETGVRGYLLTGNSEFLEPYSNAQDKLLDAVEQLESLSQQNPNQLNRVEVISKLVDQRLVSLQRNIALLSPSRGTAVLAAEGERLQTLIRGKSAMDMLRKKLGEFIAVEENRLAERQQILEQERELSRAALWLAGIIGIVGGLGANYLYTVSVVRRIHRLQHNALAVAAGEALAEPIPGEDEISQLDQALYATADQISQKQDRLQAANRQIAEAARKEKALLDNSLDVICSIDGEGRFVEVSPASLKTWGYLPHELIGRFYEEFVVPDDLEKTRAIATEALAGKSISGFENRYVRKDGSWIDIVWSASWSTTEQLLFCVARNNTERKEVERLKNEFVSTVSHELRTPLTSLRGFSEILLRKACSPEKQRQYLTIIQNESKRLTNLINDFLDLQRIESGKQNYDFAPIDVVPLLHETVDLFAGTDKLHVIRVEAPDSLPDVKADSDRIRQVLSNLVSNAIKYSPDGGEVVISAVQQDALVQISITDRGMGMAPEAMARLFTKFYRVDNANTRKIGGTGLGLALVKEIIEAHDGQVWVESELGQGSTFFFTLPQAIQGAKAITNGNHSSGAIDILLVEDDTSFTELLREEFSHTGLHIVSTAFAEQALELIQQHLPRLIFLDILLAGEMDGWDFLVAIKGDRQLASLPVMVITMTEPNTKGLVFKGAEYLPKTAAPEMLQQAVEHYLPQSSSKVLLVVDDDPNFRQQVIDSLDETADVHFIEAENGKQALEYIQQQLPDLLILDLLMPQINGFEVLQFLRSDRNTLTLPVLVMTGADLTSAEKAYLKQGLATLVSKQAVGTEALIQIVEQTLSVVGRARG
ncbi:response regulator [Leptolyngbya sp. FACHB-671]|uniref:response regulator n=1 Tax=Leptolyngbya sp. FACHB-671 TaxID=2692812 RepID=UPI00168437A5|nr:response regulator [Leptolyngbya sp. FACHB-671]MBD2071019.1 response regulator [Leptolyngbya sp. FACHB-671]